MEYIDIVSPPVTHKQLQTDARQISFCQFVKLRLLYMFAFWIYD